MFKLYYRLAKPGIVYGNLLPAIAAFFFAGKNNFKPELFTFTILGLALVIGSACVFNNIYDAGMDAKMERTKKRAMASGQILKSQAIAFGLILGLAGFLLLQVKTNMYAVGAAALGFVFYVFIYTPLKSKTQYATLIGSIPGAAPPVVGYTAVTGRLDLAAWILFLILVLWQMPHFYAIAIHRLEDYKKAGVPVLALAAGVTNTKRQIIYYIFGFIIACQLLTFYKFAGAAYSAMALAAGLWWLQKAFFGFNNLDQVVWARQVFILSLKVLLIFSSALALSPWLP